MSNKVNRGAVTPFRSLGIAAGTACLTLSMAAALAPTTPLNPSKGVIVGIAKKDGYYLERVVDSFILVSPNDPPGTPPRMRYSSCGPTMTDWAIANERIGRQGDGGFLQAGYGAVVVSGATKAVDWASIEVVVLDNKFQALVLPESLTQNQVDAAVRETQKKSSLLIKAFIATSKGYLFLPGDADPLIAENNRVGAISFPEDRGQLEGLITDLPPATYGDVRMSPEGYYWIFPNRTDHGKGQPIQNVGTGYPRRAGGSRYAVGSGLFLRKLGVMRANYEKAQVVTLVGETTILVVPEDVQQADIDKTINEVYELNGTNAEQSPIKVFRQNPNGIIVLPGHQDELLTANVVMVPILSDLPIIGWLFRSRKVHTVLRSAHFQTLNGPLQAQKAYSI